MKRKTVFTLALLFISLVTFAQVRDPNHDLPDVWQDLSDIWDTVSTWAVKIWNSAATRGGFGH